MSVQFITDDGAVLTANSDAGMRFVQLFAQAQKEYRDKKAAWVEQLRADGVKAAHPNDGWVDRENRVAQLCYPQFYDGLAVGDWLALGDHEKWIIVRVTAIESMLLGKWFRYRYEKVNA